MWVSSLQRGGQGGGHVTCGHLVLWEKTFSILIKLYSWVLSLLHENHEVRISIMVTFRGSSGTQRGFPVTVWKSWPELDSFSVA